MCCLFTTLVLIGPRAVLIFTWLFYPVRWAAAFDTFIWPLVGFIFAPWTTLTYILVQPNGLDTVDYVWLGLALLFDVFNWVGGAYGNRSRIRTYTY
jgi:hypothetical protein